MVPPKDKIVYCKFKDCAFSTKSRHMALHITNNHSELKSKSLIPLYDRVPKDGNKIFTSKFQATELLNILDSQTKQIEFLKMDIQDLKDSNKRLQTTLDLHHKSHQQEIEIIKEELASLKASLMKSSKTTPISKDNLEESKAFPISKRFKGHKRVKKFRRSLKVKHIKKGSK